MRSASQELQGGSGIDSMTIAGYVNNINQRKDALIRDIQTMRQAIGDKSQWRGVGKISAASVHAKTADLGVDYGKHTYLVDRSTGEVIKMTGGLRGAIADFAVKVANKIDSGREPVTLVERFRARVSHSLEGGAARIAHAERVGAVQAEAVLLDIYKKDPKGAHDMQVLARLRGAEARLSNIERTGSEDGKKTLFIIDEIGQTSLRDLLMVLKTAMKDGQNRLLVQGDSKQLASVGAGDTMKIMNDAGVNVSKLKEARRFVNAQQDQKLAVVLANDGNLAGALKALDARAVVIPNKQGLERVSKDEGKREFADAVAKVYLDTVKSLRMDGSGAKNTVNPSVGITTFTNSDRLVTNTAVHDLLQKSGEIGQTNFTKAHLDFPRITNVEKRNVRELAENNVDRLVMHKSIPELGITAGSVLTVSALKGESNRIEVINEHGKNVEINPEKHPNFTAAVAQRLEFSGGDKVEARAVLSVKDANGELVRISNASRGKIQSIDDQNIIVKWGEGKEAFTLKMENKDFQMVGHGYARTAHKGQGETNDVQIVAAGDKGVAFAASARSLYVAITRARLHTQVVATESGRTAMDDAALKDGGKTMASELAKEAKAEADILIAYKEYPHTDIDECAAQVTRLTLDAAQGRIRPTLALYDCRMTGTWHTTREPMRSLVNHMKGLEGIGGVLTVSLAHGFDFADVTESGTKAWAITNNDPELAQNIAADIGRRLWEIRQSINTPLLTMDAALHEVENLSIPGQSADVGPIVIADMADNPGGGARADSTFALEGLHRRGMGNIALGGLWDPGAVQICLEAGEGAWLNLRLGGKSGATSGQPLDLRVQIRAIKTDHFQTAFGARTQLGPSAWVVSEHGVDIVLISRCDQVIGTDLFTGLGIDLSTRSAVIVKSMQHFYAAFAPLARRVLYADSPGLLTSDHSHLSFKRKKLDVWPHVENPFLNST